MDLTNVGYSIWKACQNNDADELDKIIAEVSPKYSLTEVAKMVNYSPSGDTPLDQAIGHQNEHIIKMLLPFGAISIYHRTYGKNSAKFIWFNNLVRDLKKPPNASQSNSTSNSHHSSPKPAKVVDASDYGCSPSEDCCSANKSADCSSSKSDCASPKADCGSGKSQAPVADPNIVAKLQTTEQQLRVTQMELAALKQSQSAAIDANTPVNFETLTDDELEGVLRKIENDKTEISRILADRKKETCVICLNGPRNHVSIPCGHKVFCGGCGPIFVGQNCPMCRVQVQSVIKVFG